MSKKLTLGFVKEQFENEDYILLSNEYINSGSKLNYICPKGHKHRITWSMWRFGNRCPYCSKKTKINIGEIGKSFKSENYTILTKEYLNNKQLIDCICPNGNKYYIRWNDWQQGHRCGCDKCSIRYRTKKPKRINFNYIKNIIESEGCILLEDTYINNRQKLKLRLSNKEEYYTTWLSWRQGKRPWKDPKNSQPTVEEIRKSFESKGYKLLSKGYMNTDTKLEFICDRGHSNSMSWKSWKNGHICKYCSYENNSGKPKYENKAHSNIKIDGIIYKVTNKITDKVYIGQTCGDLHSRKIKHISLSNKLNVKTHFHRSINKHGKDNFTWQILCECGTKSKLDEKEIYYIKYYDSYKNGYNMTLGGEGTIGRVCKESTKRKISKSKTGVIMSEESKKRMSVQRRGVKKSKEHVANVAAAKSEYWEIIYPNGNVEIIKNLSAFCRDNNLSDRGMWLVAHNRRNHHKGFKCKKVDNIGAINGN